jgi:hypothetical protein
MRPPEDDLAARVPVWDSLQMFFMDTDPALCLKQIAGACARSPYDVAELEEILFNEVLPACRFNMFSYPAPEWSGFETRWLTQRILKKHRHGRPRPFILRWYTTRWWKRLRPMITDLRA